MLFFLVENNEKWDKRLYIYIFKVSYLLINLNIIKFKKNMLRKKHPRNCAST